MRVDDRSPAVFLEGRWNFDGDELEFQGTTSRGGGGARATFTFNGTSVQVYGTIGVRGDDIPAPEASYVVDGDSRTFGQFVGQVMNRPQYSQLLYRSPPLTDGPHNLIIYGMNNGRLWIDYYEVDGVPNPTRLISTGIEQSQPTSAPRAGSGSGNNTTVLALAGVLGGLLAIIVLGCILWFLSWKASKKLNPPPIDVPLPPIHMRSRFRFPSALSWHLRDTSREPSWYQTNENWVRSPPSPAYSASITTRTSNNNPSMMT
ncbi:hypothetical protein FA15DRAFT_99468 [Coprinopsis marcescibilis]|uniref:Uncharacterized protein n=1 Tax=Coprinopsis marcescibilis TaxID=230819 RepID=A0A5C3KKY8_COPMA|nr:hypothetical protein FA15DRAFT_99468 [Coprinopsis marcescibilis]